MEDVAGRGLVLGLFGNDGTIVPDRWLHAVETLQLVGSCRECGSPLKPLPPEVGPQPQCITWFTAQCVDCRRELTSPGGRKLARTFRTWDR